MFIEKDSNFTKIKRKNYRFYKTFKKYLNVIVQYLFSAKVRMTSKNADRNFEKIRRNLSTKRRPTIISAEKSSVRKFLSELKPTFVRSTFRPILARSATKPMRSFEGDRK